MASFRARNQSEPELPQLLPVPGRPNSSYDNRPEPKESLKFSVEVLEGMSRVLRIPEENLNQFQWIIRDCLLKLREEGWRAEVRSNEIVYVNVLTEELRSIHETVETHQELAARLLSEWRELETKRNDRLYLVQEVLFKQANSVRDVRLVCQPKLIERVLDLLGVDVRFEPYLVPRVKVLFQDAYFRIKRGDFFETASDIPALLIQLEMIRASFLRSISPSGLLYCTQCETALADGSCGSCHDAFCNACFAASHSSGHRLDHPFVFFEQGVCSECEERAAVVRCSDCCDLYCQPCFAKLHKSAKGALHCVKLPFSTVCFECDSKEAVYLCNDCDDVFCTSCSSKIHQRGARQNHTLFGLKRAAYSKKLFAGNVSKVNSIIGKHAKSYFELTGWHLFWDDALNPYWYHLITKEVIRTTIKDLLNKPSDPEGPNEVAERCRTAVMDSAVFKVPPPLHFKFSINQNTKPQEIITHCKQPKLTLNRAVPEIPN